MKIRVLYFAALRERLERGQEELALPGSVATVGQLRQWMTARGEPFAAQFAPGRVLRAAVDQTLAEPGTPLREGCEVAFFPPVTGG